MLKKLALTIILFTTLFVQFGSVSAQSNFDEEKISAVIAPSQVRIYTKTCFSIKKNIAAATPLNHCLYILGNGVVISSDGIILTTSSIGKPSVSDLITDMLKSVAGVEFFVDDILSGMGITSVEGRTLKDQIYSDASLRQKFLGDTLLAIKNGSVAFDYLTNDSYVELPHQKILIESNFEIANPGSVTKVESLITSDEINKELETNNFHNFPLLLKVSAENLPSVSLATLTDEIFSEVLVSGYEINDNFSIGNFNATRLLTSNKLLNLSEVPNTNGVNGTILEIPETATDTNALILSDIQGNLTAISGSLTILNTFSDYFIGSDYIQNLLAENEISLVPSNTDSTWRVGLDNFYNGNYQDAKTKFEEVVSNYSDHVEAKKYIQRVEELLPKEDSGSSDPLLGFLRTYISGDISAESIPAILSCCVGLVILIVLFLALASRFGKRKNNSQLPPVQNSSFDVNDFQPNKTISEIVPTHSSVPHFDTEFSNDKNQPVQAAPDYSLNSGDPSMPVVPSAPKVVPHPGEETPKLTDAKAEDVPPVPIPVELEELEPKEIEENFQINEPDSFESMSKPVEPPKPEEPEKQIQDNKPTEFEPSTASAENLPDFLKPAEPEEEKTPTPSPISESINVTPEEINQNVATQEQPQQNEDEWQPISETISQPVEQIKEEIVPVASNEEDQTNRDVEEAMDLIRNSRLPLQETEQSTPKSTDEILNESEEEKIQKEAMSLIFNSRSSEQDSNSKPIPTQPEPVTPTPVQAAPVQTEVPEFLQPVEEVPQPTVPEPTPVQPKVESKPVSKVPQQSQRQMSREDQQLKEAMDLIALSKQASSEKPNNNVSAQQYNEDVPDFLRPVESKPEAKPMTQNQPQTTSQSQQQQVIPKMPANPQQQNFGKNNKFKKRNRGNRNRNRQQNFNNGQSKQNQSQPLNSQPSQPVTPPKVQPTPAQTQQPASGPQDNSDLPEWLRPV